MTSCELRWTATTAKSWDLEHADDALVPFVIGVVVPFQPLRLDP